MIQFWFKYDFHPWHLGERNVFPRGHQMECGKTLYGPYRRWERFKNLTHRMKVCEECLQHQHLKDLAE
jgi:hypothetical protein